MKEQSKELLPSKDRELRKEADLALLKLKNEVEINEIQKEAIFKAALVKTFMPLESINSIPRGGKKIHYPKEIQEGELPETIDIQPRVIEDSLPSIQLILGKRTFDINPIIGKIKKILFTKEALEIKMTVGKVEYTKATELPDLCRRLRKTPVGK
jgi:hypothetical protein